MQCFNKRKVFFMDNKEFLIQSVKEYTLSDMHIERLYEYCCLLMKENKQYDLTAITSFEDMVKFHIIDSLQVGTLQQFNQAAIVTDIGTGAGAPGLILALVYDDKHFNLVEILQKRITFLHKVIMHFSLKNCTLIPFDFKTVIRKQLVDKKTIFISRATLSFDKLLNALSFSIRTVGNTSSQRQLPINTPKTSLFCSSSFSVISIKRPILSNSLFMKFMSTRQSII